MVLHLHQDSLKWDELIAHLIDVSSINGQVNSAHSLFILKFFRSLVADEEQFAGSEVDIRQGVLENVAAALDPAFPELAEQTQEHRSIFQVRTLYIQIRKSKIYLNIVALRIGCRKI